MLQKKSSNRSVVPSPPASSSEDAVAEWLRRLPAKQMDIVCQGSNPCGVDKERSNKFVEKQISFLDGFGWGGGQRSTQLATDVGGMMVVVVQTPTSPHNSRPTLLAFAHLVKMKKHVRACKTVDVKMIEFKSST